MMSLLFAPALALTATFSASPIAQEDGDALFRERVAPILERHCLRCHDDATAKGDMSFSGSSLPADLVEPGDPDTSLLIDVVIGAEPAMPEGAAALSASDVQALSDWIAAGAPWVEGVIGARPWWSFRPLEVPSQPDIPDEWRAWGRQPIDAFVLQGLLARGLGPSRPADRRTLLRRIHFDLVGLPPSPERVASFLADTAPDAYEREADRLLSSPRYGERWARHWLDVVHYADSHGYDKDKPRANAWPYRDYVIRALNDDMPWSRFVTEQIAGDVLEGHDPSALVATGMLAAGPWDFVGHVELREGTVEKDRTRNLDRDDIVTSVFSSFQSVTIHCARCHDHKFDSITQRDYYNLQSVFAGVERAEREYDTAPETVAQRQTLHAERDTVAQSLRAVEEELDRRMAEDERESIADLRAFRAENAGAAPIPDRSKALGYHSAIEPTADVEKWVQLDLGTEQVIDRVTIYPCDEAFGGHPGPGFGMPPSFAIRVRSTGEWDDVGRWRADDGQTRHGDRPVSFALAAALPARFVEVRVPKLWERTADFCFALAEVEVWSGGVNVALGVEVSATDTIEAGGRWGTRFLVDGRTPWTPDVARFVDAERDWIAARAAHESAAETAARAAHVARMAGIEQDLAALPERARVYTVTVDFPREGSFSPPPGGAPRPVHLLARGDVTQPGELSTPGALSALDHSPTTFELTGDGEGERRLALARWIAHAENPLTWRSAVNRVWHYHFGRGIVGSPSDFGHMGEAPTHPEMLDDLALRFRDGGGSLKALHREIVTSSTYRQSSARRSEAAAIDEGNRYLWRANRRRLEAEALRDSVLSVTGCLDLEAGGPGFRLFAFEDDHSPRYKYDEADPNDPATFRRSVYRFIVRSVPDPWMTAFDCADPSNCTPARLETTTPLQALSLLNDRFILAQSEHFAVRVASEAAPGERVALAVSLAWQRSPTPEEERLLREHAETYGLAAVCRVLLNSSEFLYVD